MTDQHVLNALTDVLAAMQRSPYAHVAQAGVFLSSAGTEEHAAVHRVLEEGERHAAELTALLIELGGSPAPAAPNIQVARLHYLDLHFILTELLRTEDQLLAACESALTRLIPATPAYHLVAGIAAAHRDHVTLLRDLTAETGT